MNKYLLFFLMACFAQAGVSEVIKVQDYYRILEALPNMRELYSDEMAADPEGCGITRSETETSCCYNMVVGMEDQPMKGVTPWQQQYYEHWAAQGEPQAEEKKATSPLMMFDGKESKEADLKAKQKSQAAEIRCHQAMTEEGRKSSSSSGKLGGEGITIASGTATHETPSEIRFGSFGDDDISAITDDATIGETTAETKECFPIFSPNNKTERLFESQDRLKQAREVSQAAAADLKLTLEKWQTSKNLEIAKKNHEELQRNLFSAYTAVTESLAVFQQAEGPLRAVLQEKNPFGPIQFPVALEHAEEFQRRQQAYQALLFPAQTAYEKYAFVQQAAAQLGVIQGTKYDELLEQAQCRANKAAEELTKREKELTEIKFETPCTPKKSQATSGKNFAASIQERQAAQAKEIFHQDQGTQISPEDLVEWEREAFLKKQAFCKPIFRRMVEQLRQNKEKLKQAKEAFNAEFSGQLLDKILEEDSKKLVSDLDRKALAEEPVAADGEKEAVLRGQVSDLLDGMVGKVNALSMLEKQLINEILDKKYFKQLSKKVLSSAKNEALLAKKERIFYELFRSGSEATEREKWEQYEASITRREEVTEAHRREMEKFCAEYRNLLHPSVQAERPLNWMETIVPYVKNTGSFLWQCSQSPYQWGRNMLQLFQDQTIVIPKAKKEAKEFFANQGREVADVPTIEYANKYAQIAQRLYVELAKQRKREEETRQRAEREGGLVLQVAKDPCEELTFFEQIPIFLKNRVLFRAWNSRAGNKIIDEQRESDMRAREYFRTIGKEENRLWISEFWDKSAEIEEALKIERTKKREEIMRSAASPIEGERQFQEWCCSWPERLQAEEQQRAVAKENARLEAERLVEEEKQKALFEQVRLAQEQELKRKQIEEELLSQEKKKNFSKKKKPKK